MAHNHTEEPRNIARIFKVLSVENRVKIIQMLKREVLCVGALASRLGISPAAASQHLRVLRDAELVVSEKRGYYVHYRLNPEMMSEWRDIADRLLEYEEAEGTSCCGGENSGEKDEQ
ncbi:MAG: ArsR/SmtB family transcription factor [Planctomycetota bacterium]